ncbi:hypothetical protein [uncultured Lacinutrix sp.]|uniref:hypothetical protein n=1 Tax=uncultured Lacinutrix sp. TaxID=574032 RepID=UPI0026016248|nr:hypothetical protein [uncultured Lacinutrix sp.]
MKSIKFLKLNGEEAGGCNQEYFFERYFQGINIGNDLKTSLKNKIDSSIDFAIPVSELILINEAIENKIDELISHPEFNPYKEQLRKKFKEQYESNPFVYKGKTYYLFSKGGEFAIDREIEVINSYNKQVKAHIENDVGFKHLFKTLN